MSGPEPVEIAQRRECHFKKKAADPETGKKRLGCARCGRAKGDPAHFGAPDSLNLFASSGPMVYRNTKQAWSRIFVALLEKAELERGVDRVVVEGQVTFPDKQRRDQGNYRFIIEKALGDALVEGGWLADDDWTRYEFGGLAYRYEKGVSETRLLLFPAVRVAPADPVVPPAQGSLLAA